MYVSSGEREPAIKSNGPDEEKQGGRKKSAQSRKLHTRCGINYGKFRKH